MVEYFQIENSSWRIKTMKRIYGIVLLLLLISGYGYGQDTARVRAKSPELQPVKPIMVRADSLRQKDVFVDRDGDGINDLLMRTSWMRMGRFRKGAFEPGEGIRTGDGSGLGPGQQHGSPDATGPKKQQTRRGRN
jgi:hypothetical protein